MTLIDKKTCSVSGIYQIHNSINEKCYIGQTKNLYQRQCNHIGKLNRNIHPNKHLQNAWNKYGEDHFDFIILELCKVEKLNEREKYWIEFYKSNLDGYNIRIDPVTNRGLIWSNEQREKMKEIMNDENGWYKNHTLSEKARVAARIAVKNRIWTQKERKRQSQILSGTKVKDTSNMCLAQAGETNGFAKLTEDEAKQIIYLLMLGYEGELLSSIYRVNFSTISAIKKQRSWRNLDRKTIANDSMIKTMALKSIHKYISRNLKPISEYQQQQVLPLLTVNLN